MNTWGKQLKYPSNVLNHIKNYRQAYKNKAQHENLKSINYKIDLRNLKHKLRNIQSWVKKH